MLRGSEANVAKNILDISSVADMPGLPALDSCKKPFEMGLWALAVVKSQIKRLTADQIASIIRDVGEVSIEAKSISRAFSRAGDRIHTYHDGNETYYEIMKPGKEYLCSLADDKSVVKVFYFEPGKRYTSKQLLAEAILSNLKGELRIIDPYCGARTLDVLGGMDRPIKFLTRLENIPEKARKQFLRELEDFKAENRNIEFRHYPNTDIHDRYIISQCSLVILGHSIKDLGSKESFALVLDAAATKDIVEALEKAFDLRWAQSSIL